MDDLPRRELLKLIARKGIRACHDPGHLEGELSGLCGGCEKEVFVLATALRKDVISELLRASDTSPIGEKVSRLAVRLHELGLDRQAAIWAVETWAMALGLMEEVDTDSSPLRPGSFEPSASRCPRCSANLVADPGRVVCQCGWICLVERGGRVRPPEDLIVVTCPTCMEDGQHYPDNYVQCYSCGKSLRLDQDNRVLNEVEVRCPNPDSECGVNHQFRKTDLPKRVECGSCTWTFEVDAEGKTRTPEGLIDVECPFCEQSSQHYSAGEVECYQPGCGKTLLIDEKGRVLSKVIEIDCPRLGCETIQNVEAAGQVVCDGCGHKYTIDENGDIVDPGEGVWEVECDGCKATFYKDAYSEEEHFAGGYECPYCKHWHGHDVEVECPNPDDDCGTPHEFKRSELPKRVECDGCGWIFEVDAEGILQQATDLIEVICPFCERSSQHGSEGEVECPMIDCQGRLLIDETGRILKTFIEAECPILGCGTVQYVEVAGQVICDECGHKYTIDQEGDVVDPG